MLTNGVAQAPPMQQSSEQALIAALQALAQAGQAPESQAAPGPANCEPDRIFVGGLPQVCDDETLALFFSQFGSIVEASVNTDPATGRSKGFGFVRFEQAYSVDLAIQNSTNNIIAGKWVNVKR